MKIYQKFATVLTSLLGADRAVRLTVPGFMPLSVEDIGQSADGNRLISICHYGEQNGDLMRDPEMVFELFTHGEASAAEPLSFQNDYMGVFQEVYRYDESGKKNPRQDAPEGRAEVLRQDMVHQPQGARFPRRHRHSGAAHLSPSALWAVCSSFALLSK